MQAVLGRHSAHLPMVRQHAAADTGRFANRRGVSDDLLRGKLETYHVCLLQPAPPAARPNRLPALLRGDRARPAWKQARGSRRDMTRCPHI